MRHDREMLEAAVSALIGLPLWASNRAADLQSFQFGAQHVVVARFGPKKGTERTVGDYALHIQCAWRIAGPAGIVAASRDRYAPAGDVDNEPPDWRWDVPGANRCDERVAAWIRGNSFVVQSVGADALGGLTLTLSHDFALEVFPDDSLDGEHWRLFQPSREAAHFVVAGSGVT